MRTPRSDETRVRCRESPGRVDRRAAAGRDQHVFCFHGFASSRRSVSACSNAARVLTIARAGLLDIGDADTLSPAISLSLLAISVVPVEADQGIVHPKPDDFLDSKSMRNATHQEFFRTQPRITGAAHPVFLGNHNHARHRRRRCRRAHAARTATDRQPVTSKSAICFLSASPGSAQICLHVFSSRRNCSLTVLRQKLRPLDS